MCYHMSGDSRSAIPQFEAALKLQPNLPPASLFLGLTSVLQGWARDFGEWRREGKDVYCYFDNDQSGYAAKDALRLKELVAAVVY